MGSFVNAASATATTLTYPTGIQAGDLIILFGHRTATTAPSNPSGFLSYSTTSGNSNSGRISYKYALGTESGTTSPAMTNATQVVCVVYRGLSLGAVLAHNSATGTTQSFGALTLGNTNGLSWIIGFSGSSQGTSESTPTNFTQRAQLKNSTTSMVSVWDWANQSSASTFSSTLGTTAVHEGFALELCAYNQNPNGGILSTPANGATGVTTQPNMQVATADPDTNTLTHNVQIDTSSSFNSGGHTNPAFVQQVRADATGFNTTLTSAAFGSSTTSGNAIVVAIYLEANALDALSVTDAKSNTYVPLALGSYSTPVGVSIWIAQNITGGASHTVTVNDVESDIMGFTAIEVSGLPTSGPVLEAYGVATASSITGSTITATLSQTTSNPNSLLMMFAALNGTDTGTWSAGSIGGSTGANLSSDNNTTMVGAYASQTQLVSSASAFSGSFGYTVSGPYVAVIIALGGSATPSINAFSATGGHDAAQFSDITTPADTDPFPSGDTIQLAVPSGEALSNGTYYWRSAAKDPTGSKGWGVFSPTRSFTVGSSTPTNLFFF